MHIYYFIHTHQNYIHLSKVLAGVPSLGYPGLLLRTICMFSQRLRRVSSVAAYKQINKHIAGRVLR